MHIGRGFSEVLGPLLSLANLSAIHVGCRGNTHEKERTQGMYVLKAERHSGRTGAVCSLGHQSSASDVRVAAGQQPPLAHFSFRIFCYIWLKLFVLDLAHEHGEGLQLSDLQVTPGTLTHPT